MQARKRAPQTVAQKKKQKLAIQPAQQIQNIFSIFQDVIGVILFLGGTFSLGSLAVPEMNSLTQWLADLMHLLFGKTAVLTGIAAIVFGVWLLVLRRLEKPFSFSWRVFTFIALFYLFSLVVIQRFAVMEAPFNTPAEAGGVFGKWVDELLTGAVGSGGTLIILFFIAVVFLLFIWREIVKAFPDSLRQKLDVTSKMIQKIRPIFEINSETDQTESQKPGGIPLRKLPKEPKESAVPEQDSSPDQAEPAEQQPKPKSGISARLAQANLLNQKKKQNDHESDEKKQDKPLTVVIPAVEKTQPAAAEPFTPPLIHKIEIPELSKTKLALPEKWKLPARDEILDNRKVQSRNTPDDPYIQAQVQKIEHVLDIFDAPGKVIDIQCGPTFTQFGIEPGFLDRQDRKVRVRVKQIEALKKDLEMALSVKQLTIEAPIPGKTYIGLQVQNRHREGVSLREVIEGEGFSKYQNGLGIALGKDIYGDVFAADLTRMPHLLIAGATGSGKSVCLNAILVCLLMHHSPETLKLVLIDPKRVELTGYNGIPHLVRPVVTEVEHVYEILQWVLQEMDSRNLRFLEAGVRNIQDYNQKFTDQRLPYLVVVIDELANLMMEAASDIESSITRLAQTARAMGIHLVVATQRPSRDVITGTIKGNLPSRIAFAVATNTDSMVILDRVGAEDLFGRGDMYLMSAESSNLKRLQGVFVSDEEIRRLVEYWRKNPKIAESDESREPSVKQPVVPVTIRKQPEITDGLLTQLPLLDENEPAMRRNADPLLEEAIALVRKQGRASANMLVSRLSIGFSRANKLLVYMEEEGIISPPNSNPAIPRDILDYGENGPPVEEA